MKWSERRMSPSLYLCQVYSGMEQRSKLANRTCLSREEFYSFAKQNEVFLDLHKKWVDSGFQRRLNPTVDRIDFTKGYVIGNMQFLTHSENVVKGHAEIPKAPPNKKYISKAVALSNAEQTIRFESGKDACDWLGVSRSQVCIAIKKHKDIKGWKPHYA